MSVRSGFLSGPYGIAETSGYRDNRGDEREGAGGDWLNGPPEGSFLFWCVAWWSRGCCGLSAVLRCGGAAPWSVWILRVWVVSGVCERQVQSTTGVFSCLIDPVGVFSCLWLLLLEFEVSRRLCGEASFSGYWVPNSGRRDRVGPLTRAPLDWTARCLG